jgi:nicotinamide-nucleotide amidase
MAAAGDKAVIVSRVLRTWGTSESALAEALAARMDALDAALAEAGARERGAVTIAFLASGIEGLKLRLTARAADAAAAKALLDAEEAEVRRALEARFGDVVFGVDDESMEHAVARLLKEQGLWLGLAESLTGGLMAARLVDVPGASTWFKGAVVSYAKGVKQSVLAVPEGPVVSGAAARAMAEGARRVLGADVGLGITGVAGPDEDEGQPVGTVFVGLAMPGRDAVEAELHLPGDRPRVRQYAAISALDLLRRALDGRDGDRAAQEASRRW